MTEAQVLKLLYTLVKDAAIMQTDPDDLSGLNTKYFVDQEQLLRNIEAKLEECHGE